MRKIYFTLILSMVFSIGYSQSIDQKKMEKDLEVAKNVLATVMQKQSSNRFLYRNSDNISAKYVEDYGVMFTIENRFGLLTAIDEGTWSVGYSDAVRAYSDAAKGYQKGVGKVSVGKRDRKEKDDEDASVVIADVVAPKIITTENLKVEDDGSMQKAFIGFLKDYSTLIRQLKPSDKIMIKTSSRNRGYGNLVIAGMGRVKAASNTSIEAVKRDLDDYTDGKINDTQLEAKLVIKESSTDLEKEPEIEVFSSIINRLYQSDMSDTYYVGNSPWYERTQGIGLNYYLKFYSSMEGDGLFYLPTIDKEKVDSKERNKIVNNMYPDFLDGFKENILEYGHLLKNLKDNESLTFNIDLTKCDDCDMPQEIEVSVKKSVIDQYRGDKISLSQAKGKVKVRDIR